VPSPLTLETGLGGGETPSPQRRGPAAKFHSIVGHSIVVSPSIGTGRQQRQHRLGVHGRKTTEKTYAGT
jgi:hypothetical protein